MSEIREGLGGSRHISARASAGLWRIDGLRVVMSSGSSATSFSSCGREYTIMMFSRSPLQVTLSRTHGEIRVHCDDTGRSMNLKFLGSRRKGGSIVTKSELADLRLDQERMIVLPLKPRFADAILTGEKTVELRRAEPKIVVPTRALILFDVTGACTGRYVHRCERRD